jgi:hypothetical protein
MYNAYVALDYFIGRGDGLGGCKEISDIVDTCYINYLSGVGYGRGAGSGCGWVIGFTTFGKGGHTDTVCELLQDSACDLPFEPTELKMEKFHA